MCDVKLSIPNVLTRIGGILPLAGLLSLAVPFSFLLYMLLNICINVFYSLHYTKVLLPVEVSQTVDRQEATDTLFNSLCHITQQEISFVDFRNFLSSNAVHEVLNHQPLKGELWVPLSSEMDKTFKNKIYPAGHKSDILQILIKKNRVKKFFNSNMILGSDSRDLSQAGILGAIVGSLLTIAICLTASLPIGILSGIYMQEFMPKNRLFNAIENAINNLAATPAIIFGILGLSIYINFIGIPRSSPLAGGLTLAMMMLPSLIINTRQAFANIPQDIRHAALALGALRVQFVIHHALPLAMSSIVTGIIFGIARVIGESAPLLIIGMMAFVADVPGSIYDPATVFPTQIYMWSSTFESGFKELSAVMILALLLFLSLLKIIAYFIRKKFTIKYD